MGESSPVAWLIVLALLAFVAVAVALYVRPRRLPRPARPGWFTDPQNPALLRWHDGHRWTARTQPRG